LYSANENIAKSIEEYSTLNPETNSASASGKSNGVLLVSASNSIKNIKAFGKVDHSNHTEFSCMCRYSKKLKLPTNKTLGKITSKKITSYDIN
jgi:hypothetical protein